MSVIIVTRGGERALSMDINLLIGKTVCAE